MVELGQQADLLLRVLEQVDLAVAVYEVGELDPDEPHQLAALVELFEQLLRRPSKAESLGGAGCSVAASRC
jgi:hypothetical protein